MTTASAFRSPDAKRSSGNAAIRQAGPGKARDQGGESAVRRLMISRARVKFPAQAPMSLPQGMVGQSRQQVMERVIAQPDRRPQRGESGRRRHVDAVEELLRDAHRLAVILPQMGDERAHLVEEHDAGSDREEDEEGAERNEAARTAGSLRT